MKGNNFTCSLRSKVANKKIHTKSKETKNKDESMGKILLSSASESNKKFFF